MMAGGSPPARSGRGLFITFEGGEGTGKSTQAERLANRLQSQGRRTLLLREPGGTPLGEQLRTTLLHGSEISMEAQLLLFLAARAQLVISVIRPALREGAIVICDRFSDSTLAYQGYGQGLDIGSIRSLNRWATGGLEPGLTLLLDAPPEVGRQRTQGDDDTFQRKDEAFHTRVREGYLSIAASQPARWLVLDARQSPEAIAHQVWERVQTLAST